MLGRVVFFAVILSAIAISAPSVAPGLLSITFHAGKAPAVADQAPPATAVEPAPVPPDLPDRRRDDARRVTLRANAEGHFVADAVIDGRTVTVMVDTGATLVAITDTTARRLGLYPPRSDYRERLSTANGMVMAARVTLDNIRLGDVFLRDVEAVIVPGNALPVDLLGMSFLSRLSKFEIAGRQLVLSQ